MLLLRSCCLTLVLSACHVVQRCMVLPAQLTEHVSYLEDARELEVVIGSSGPLQYAG